MRTLLALVSLLPPLLLGQAVGQSVSAPTAPTVTVSNIAPDSAGNIPFGCPLSPFSAGTNMGVNAMLSNCSLTFMGPVETQAQSAIDIAAAIAAIPPATPYTFVVGSPNAKGALTAATAYQAGNTAKAAGVVVNLISTATISLSGGTTNSATVVIGPTNAVASGTGTAVCSYSNSNTGALTIGLNLSTISAVPCSFTLPAGWFYAYRVSSGTVTAPSAFDSSLG